MSRRPPGDVVPPTPLTREQVLHLNDLIGQAVELVEPGKVLCDDDGIGVPYAVAPARASTAILGGWSITHAEATRLGLTREDIPRVRIVD